MDEELREILKLIREDIKVLTYKVDRNTEKIDDIGLDLKVVERNVRRDIRKLSDENETIVEVLRQHNILSK
ncbi:MAG: hypothetical protein WCD89_04040 [Anaerocolumna sp.]